MNNFQTSPLKLYIQDLFRAKTTKDKYVYEIFGLTFKNVMVHGVVTSLYNTLDTTTNIELSDATGSVQIYYNSTKGNTNISTAILKDLVSGFSEATRSGNDNIYIMSTMLNRVSRKSICFTEGDYLSVIGDMFVDDKNVRMISAFECIVTSVERDIIWIEELRYLYEKFYLCNKVINVKT